MQVPISGLHAPDLPKQAWNLLYPPASAKALLIRLPQKFFEAFGLKTENRHTCVHCKSISIRALDSGIARKLGLDNRELTISFPAGVKIDFDMTAAALANCLCYWSTGARYYELTGTFISYWIAKEQPLLKPPRQLTFPRLRNLLNIIKSGSDFPQCSMLAFFESRS